MIFRWSIWGEHVSKNIELLRYSIFSFKKQFDNNHQYIVYTDNPDFVTRYLNQEVDIRRFPLKRDTQFCINSKATWRKWCPSPRLDIKQDEFYIDSDVFLLRYPKEVDTFLSNSKLKFAILDEFRGQPYQHGVMHKKATSDTPFVNAGFFIQKAGSDISKNLVRELYWWQENVKDEERTHHDEQGALAIALTKYLMSGELFIFPKEKYMQISETSNPDIENLDDVTLFHATYPTHPAFYKFKHILDEALYKKIKPKLKNDK
ncbi:MAG: hypothetical protein UW81_C0031G0004 [Candidatus Giovannonibacteria bacterium GW2011_GWC2_44_9]|uniref:Nucleotide-diphospho-sugar transferase domain-containing protein n=2 Tax=Candidatus Giovannoniibacteriota TaxID=1752738 RepID=A0A0G1L1K3_9BACT|nr:MAG: hypothetical protein UW57_C0016G0005 [Candidatus Giovannonibacteria bacterium GW2011_GWA1_44_29]KKT82920.1 MAG: hypothetical protein UW81_C0031G0004 [Candidatus Giovannonibacteria bacterium GW2011_GWC2_44_9]KKT90814.1 MAG: hypothetical protein UW93_C0020G0004 [Parcubacteria group bacterium GW2011_GWC1_45_13]